MLEEKCEELKKEVFKNMELLKTDINHAKKYEIAAKMQEDFIKYGTFLEDEAGLQETRVINELQVACELCYAYAETHALTLSAFLYLIKHQMIPIEKRTYTCVPKGAYDLSVVAIVRNENYMQEWIEYHRMVGVSHFYIYDNESTNNIKEQLKYYIDSGIVTYIYFPGNHVQSKAYMNAINHFKFDTKYMAVIDGDEYIIPMQDAPLSQIVEQIFEDYDKLIFKTNGYAGGVGINWREYGTSYHKTKQDGLCIENYMYRAPDDYFQNAHIKTIFIPRIVTDYEQPHFPVMKEGWRNISEHGSTIPYSYFYDSMCKKLRINHYFCKSEQEFMEKLKRGWPDQEHVELKQNKVNKEMSLAKNICNEIYDPIMEKYIKELKERLKYYDN